MKDNMQPHMDAIRHAAAMMQDAVYEMAKQAMRDMNPHAVAWIVTEHDKLDRIVRRLHSLTSE